MDTDKPSSGPLGLSWAWIIGIIVLAALLLICLVAAAIVCCIRSKRDGEQERLRTAI